MALLILLITIIKSQVLQSNTVNLLEKQISNPQSTKECPEKPTNFLHDLSEGVYFFSPYENIYGCQQNLLKLNIYKCKLFLYSCRFTSIRANDNGGGAISLTTTEDTSLANSESRIENCIFINCTDRSIMYGGGGAILIKALKRSYFTFHLIGNVFNGNSAENGGAVYFEAVNGNIESNRFIGNSATKSGESIYFRFSISDKESRSVTVKNNYFEHSSEKSKSILCFNSMSRVLFDFVDNTINVTAKSDDFHVFSADVIYGNNADRTFKNNRIFPPLEEDRSILNDRLFTVNLSDSFVDTCTTILPDDSTESTGPLPDVILNNGNCNRDNRCNYSVFEKRNVFVLVEVSYFWHYNQPIENGGAIYLFNCAIQCHGASFQNCSSSIGGGGAIYVKNTFDVDNNVSLVNNKFIQCSAVYGGAIYIYSNSELANVLIKLCSFQSNRIIEYDIGELKGGSACFLTVKEGLLINCFYFAEKSSGSLIKVSNDFDSNLVKSSSQNHIAFANCNFDLNEVTESVIYFVNQERKVELRNCNFKGKLNDKSSYIDGDSFSMNSQDKIKVISCIFEYNSMIDDMLKFNLLWIFMVCITTIGVLTFFIFSLVKTKFEKNYSHEKNIEFDEDLVKNNEYI